MTKYMKQVSGFARWGLWICLLAGAGLVSCAKKTGGAAERVGFVDLPTVFEGYSKIEIFDKTLETEGQARQEQREVIVSAIRKMRDELSLLAESARQGRQAEMDAKLKELEAFDEEVRQTLGKKRSDYLQEVFDDIENVVNDYADEHDFDFVFSSRAMIFKKDQYNVTKAIIRELNRRYDKDAPQASV